MMVARQRILLRSGKDPFKIVSAENTWQTNLIGNNSGNLLFSTAATRILSTKGTKVVANGLRPNPDDAEEINEKYDALVLPFANAFRPQFEGRLRRFAELIERLSIPVVVFGCGAQAGLSFETEQLHSMSETVKRFARAVLDRSASIGVRGEFTEGYLRGLGFRDVEVIGCPSMFMFGDRIGIEKVRKLGPESRIAVNAPSSNAKLFGSRLGKMAPNYPNLTYVAQDRRELEQLLWGQSVEAASKGGAFPANAFHPLSREDRVRFFLDPWVWIEWMRGRDFSFGTRIHGNFVALLAGTPAFVLAHDSRTTELAEYFEVPYRMIREGESENLRIEELYEEADYSRFEKGHDERVRRASSFLDRNGLEHVLNDPVSVRDFEGRLKRTQYPLPVGPAAHSEASELVHRIRWLRSRYERVTSDLGSRVMGLEERLESLERDQC